MYTSPPKQITSWIAVIAGMPGSLATLVIGRVLAGFGLLAVATWVEGLQLCTARVLGVSPAQDAGFFFGGCDVQ